mmetsp:Transcript_7883/g.21887  ORF Transcript_7883/g.21887 Transcript_7883/m.21887 type:complete len:324 (-) Transcript_7883:249-1220(-)
MLRQRGLLLLVLLGVSLLLGANGDNHHNPENAGCPIACHHGKCVEVEVGVEYRCDCHEPGHHSQDMVGYAGPSCDIPYKQCPDYQRRCYNNAECVPSKIPGMFDCDCSAAFAISSYAGHECQYSATEICEAGTPVSDDAFCVNGGKCRKTVLKGEDHPGCDCSEEFEGSKCQFLKGTAPEGEGTPFVISRPMNKSDERMNPGVVAVIVLVSLGFVLGVAALIYVKKRDERVVGKKLESNDKDGSSSADMQTSGESSNGGSDGFANDDTNGGSRDLVLEADGSGTLGDESPEKKAAGIGSVSNNADALGSVEGGSDEESGLEML